MKLCIDPGHGYANRGIGSGYDPGACAAGVTEADIVLAWALTLKWAMQRAGIECWLTRDDDSDPDPVSTRDDRAEQAGCTHFLSLHANSGGGTGIETFYRDGPDRAFAQRVHAAALHATGLPNRGIKLESASQHRRLAVFDFDGPAALVELGFLDRARDRGILLARERRIAFAEALIREMRAAGLVD